MNSLASADTSLNERASLLGWDCVEFWVGNARTTAGFLMSAFGFECTSYAGPETGVTTKASYVLEQGDIRFVVSGALSADSPIAEHVRKHGDGVHDLALRTRDAAAAFRAAIERGALPVREPWTEADESGVLELAQVAAFGETVHTFVNRSGYEGTRLEPGYLADNLPSTTVGPSVGLTRIDHIVGNVEKGRLAEWVGFYCEVFGFDQLQQFDDAQIRTEYSALMSTVVWDGAKIVMPINEPADGLKKSQIQEYIEHYDGAGVQHIALRTDDIVSSVQALRDRGVRFMRVPDQYYVDAKSRLAAFDLPWADLQRLNILADQDRDGYLLQIFTETITDRPAVFFEIIERRGAKGFGEGNFKALFEAIERDQDRRGNL
ncbi:MAG: 4-hydroxyphenylpyruvate dioxygenase [Ilumatobacteraceae bacterium]|nr:4-hydroxyphenylpyruvate dioxygenase [Ilumatobacteraceae bacterium]